MLDFHFHCKQIIRVVFLDDYANQVQDSGGVYFVPAFSGLLSPHWRDDALGYALKNITGYVLNELF